MALLVATVLYLAANASGAFVAVGSGGKILGSPDGDAWLARTNPSNNDLGGVAHGRDNAGNSLWVAVGQKGTILTSPDSASWTRQCPVAGTPLGTGTGCTASTVILTSVAYGNGLWVAVGSGSTILTSKDGVNWTPRSASSNVCDLSSVAFGEGPTGGPLWVAVAQSQCIALNAGGSFTPIATSSDGVAWMTLTQPANTVTGLLRSVSFGKLNGNNLWVAVGVTGTTSNTAAFNIWSSRDGSNWVSQQAVPGQLNAVASGPSQWVAVAAKGTGGTFAYVSPAGAGWTGKPTDLANTLTDVEYGDSKWVTVGYTGVIGTSSDGLTWTPRASGPGSPSLTSVGYKPNVAPIAADQILTLGKNSATSLTLGATDADAGDRLTYAIVTGPMPGATVTGGPGSSWTYSPKPGYAGTDSFGFKANDGFMDSNIATVSITVTNKAPMANNVAFITNKDAAKQITLDATDADGDPLTYSLVALPMTGASVVGGPGPEWTYTPKSGFCGKDSFSYKVGDGTDYSSIAKADLTVNCPPLASGAAVTTNKNVNLPITLVATDSDGDPLTYSILPSAMVGAITGGTSASRTYSPQTDSCGPDSFTFKANDGTADSNSATVRINVNCPPYAQDVAVTTVKDTPKAITLDASDPDGDALAYLIVAGPMGGAQLVGGPGPDWTYTPPLAYCGPDSFTFKTNDGNMASNVATVSVVVNCAVNQAPAALDQSVSAQRNTAQPIALDADDADGDPLSFAIDIQPMPGATILGGPGAAWTYTPKAGYCGSDSFTFTAFDGTDTSPAATVAITVVCPVNAPPIAADQTLTIAKNTGTPLTLFASDAEGDALTYELVTPPMSGTSLVTFTGPTWSYTPTNGFVGADSFRFRVFDGADHSNVATVSFIITNSAPIANDMYVATSKDTAKNIFLAAADADGDSLTYSLVSPPMIGASINGSAGATWSYTPKFGFSGTDSFTFAADDGIDRATATVMIVVTNHVPLATTASYTTPKNTPLQITLQASDADVNDALSYVVTGAPMAGATVSGSPSPSWSYTPKPGYAGADSFSFVASDGSDTSDVATILITVTNTAPVARDDPQPPSLAASSPLCYVAYTGHRLTIPDSRFPDAQFRGLLFNDIDPDGDPLGVDTATVSALPGLDVAPDGSFTFDPGLATRATLFSYKATDASLQSAQQTASICVVQNQPPAAQFKSSAGALTGQMLTFTDMSFDPDGVIASKSWDFGDGRIGEGAAASHLFLHPGTYAVTHTVTDNAGASATVVRTVTIVDASEYAASAVLFDPGVRLGTAPLANAGADYAAQGGTTLSLHGRANGASSGYFFVWRQEGGPAVRLSNNFSSDPSFQAPPGALHSPTNLTFSLVVGDGSLTSAPDLVEVTLLPRSSVPIAVLGPPQSARIGQMVTLSAEASFDPDGEVLAYEWTQLGGPQASLENSDTGTPTFLMPDAPAGSVLTYRVNVTDGFDVASAVVHITTQSAQVFTPTSVTSDATTPSRLSREAGSQHQLPALGYAWWGLLLLASAAVVRDRTRG